MKHATKLHDDTPLIGAQAAAALLEVDRSTVVRAAQSGALPAATKMGGLRGPYLFRMADVIAYRDARRKAVA